MIVITEPMDLQQQCREWRCQGATIGLVPTMGYFHAGHESLMAAARNRADKVVVSLFVNPTQFGPGEDLDAYPRDTAHDASLARTRDIDILFMPEASAMYPAGFATRISVPDMESLLCGQSRPTHFQGVCTVVSKLFMLSMPHFAFFGQKDWQQLAIIRRMAKDLNIAVEVVGCPIVREADGLALSSRNAYLTEAERAKAPFFHKGLRLAESLVAQGQSDTALLASAVRVFWQKNLPEGRPDYLEFVHPETLASMPVVSGPVLAAAAMYLGKARLIDNLLMTP